MGIALDNDIFCTLNELATDRVHRIVKVDALDLGRAPSVLRPAAWVDRHHNAGRTTGQGAALRLMKRGIPAHRMPDQDRRASALVFLVSTITVKLKPGDKIQVPQSFW